MSNQSKAERLAAYWAAKNDQGEYLYSSLSFREETADELRRLHAVNQELLEALKNYVDGCSVGVNATEVARAAIKKAEE
jgi:hypothetical protein